MADSEERNSPSTRSRRSGAIERAGRSRCDRAARERHDHPIDLETGAVVEFMSGDIEALRTAIARRLGDRVVSRQLELRAVPLGEDAP